MSRFDAADPAERRKLFADAIGAHRTRGSAFLTVEADRRDVTDTAPADADTDAPPTDADVDADGEPVGARDDAGPPLPWIQFAENTFNLDCTDDELARLESLLEAFPEFRIDQLEAPEGADGTNVRVTARSDANRLAAFLDRCFQTVYDLESDYRAWVVEI